MSESISATPAAAEPGPTAGTSAGVVDTAAPAASSLEVAAVPVVETAAVVTETPAVVAEPATVPAPAAETTTEERAPSLLSEAKPEETKTEAKPDEPKLEEVVPEAPKPLPAPVYEKFTLPEGVNLADDKLQNFTGLLGEFENRIVTTPAEAHTAMQEMGQKMVDLFITESRDQAERYTRLQRDNWGRTIESWRGEFRDDAEIGGNRADTSLSRMAGLMEMYGQKAGSDRLSKLRDVLTFTGAGDNLEVLRFVNWAASRLVETAKPVAAIGPRAPGASLSRAQRMYPSTRGAV